MAQVSVRAGEREAVMDVNVKRVVEDVKPSALLEMLAQKAVKHIDETPCMHFVSQDGVHQRHTVPPVVVEVPQLWRGITEHLSHDSPDAMVLVHRVHDGESGACLSSCPTGEGQSASLCSNKLLSAGLVDQIMAGKVGDCCEKDHDFTFTNEAIQSALRQSDFYNDVKLSSQSPIEGTAFWGLVIQSSRWPNLEGCYLMKTVKVADHTGCTCTHFSLIRVCKGVPLSDQYSAAWLV